MVPSVGARTWGGEIVPEVGGGTRGERCYLGWKLVSSVQDGTWGLSIHSFMAPKHMHIFTKLNTCSAHMARVSRGLLSLVEDEFHDLSSATSSKGPASPGGFGQVSSAIRGIPSTGRWVKICLALTSSAYPGCAVHLVAQLCPTLCNPMDCSSLSSSVHGTLQARILERVAFPFSRGPSQPRDQTEVCRITGRFFTIWTREAQFLCFVSLINKDIMFRFVHLLYAFISPQNF